MFDNHLFRQLTFDIRNKFKVVWGSKPGEWPANIKELQAFVQELNNLRDDAKQHSVSKAAAALANTRADKEAALAQAKENAKEAAANRKHRAKVRLCYLSF